MNTYLVLTVIGDDKPGLVESLSSVIADHQGNWLESSMSQLAGKFAGILKVSVNKDHAEALVQGLQGLSSDLKLVIEEAAVAESEEEPLTVELNLMGNDRPGIVREISHALAVLSINVEQLSTECSPAPMSGAQLFKTRAVLRVPKGVALDDLQNELENLADDLMVEIKSGSDE
jgi:glycine cleavage system regulatory protein